MPCTTNTSCEVQKKLAAEIRINALKAIREAGSGHVGGAMSIADALAVLYSGKMKFDPANPNWEDRDWLVMSKGHAGPALYGALAAVGFFDEELLKTLNKPGTKLPSHCDKTKTPGVDMTTGSLGQGISTAIGVALGHKLQGKTNCTYLILGDGECDEGQVWEGALFAAAKKVDNLIAFVDKNQKQLDGYTDDVCPLGDLRKKFEDFGWYAQEVDGHDVCAIDKAIDNALGMTGKPSMIVLNTIKGKGCFFAETAASNHHMSVSAQQADEAIAQIAKENGLEVL